MPPVQNFCGKYSLRTGCIVIVWVNLVLDLIAMGIVTFSLLDGDKNDGKKTVAAFVFTLLLMEMLCLIYATLPLYINRTKLSAMTPFISISTTIIVVSGVTLSFLCILCDNCHRFSVSTERNEGDTGFVILSFIILAFILMGLKTYTTLVVYSYYKIQRNATHDTINNLSGSAEAATSSERTPTAPTNATQPDYSPFYAHHPQSHTTTYVPPTLLHHIHAVPPTYIPHSPAPQIHRHPLGNYASPYYAQL